jgi:sterol desaturase/sphingolipid hydroxylase (fatty acid hydroxylase superfamily)
MDVLRSALTVGLFPLNMFGGLALAWWASQQGMSAAIIVVAITLLSAATVFAAERINPAHERWNRSHGDVGTDVIHAAVSQAMVPELTRLALLALVLGVADDIQQAWGMSLWPHDWPIVMQLCLAMAISGFGEYWGHRLMHEVPAMWRLHATHHSPKRLYFLNAARFHPLDVAILYTLFFVPLMLLGVSPEIMLLQMVWISIHGLYQHCNVRLRLGPLNWIYSMAELHRWHHSLVLEEANSNYGNNILLWDIVFGTVHWPRDRAASSQIGLHDLPDFPGGWWGQIASPFRWRQITAVHPRAES